MIRGDKLVLWEVIVLVIARKKSIWTSVLLWIAEIELFESPDLTPLDFCLWDCIKSDVYKRKADTQDKLLVRILDATVRTQKREDKLRRTTRKLRTRITKCIEIDGGICEHLLWNVMYLSFLWNK